MSSALRRSCGRGIDQAQTIWLGKKSADVIVLAYEKYGLMLNEFGDEADAGIAETNWYFQKLSTESIFHPGASGNSRFQPAARCYLLVDDDQLEMPRDEAGLLSMRQHLLHWIYNDKSEPQPSGGLTLDCLRMCLVNFALTATAMTEEERLIAQLPDELKPEAVMAKLGTEAFVEAHWAQRHALGQLREKEDAEAGEQIGWLGKRPVQHRFKRWGSGSV